MSFSKFRKRIPWKKLQLVVLNSLNNLVPPFFTLLLSLLVVRLASIELWGEYTRLMLLLTLLSQMVAWGNKEYLSREFSRSPKAIESLWFESIVSRSILLVPLVIFIFTLTSPIIVKGYLAIILLSRFIFQSFDSILLYRRHYSFRIVLELTNGSIFAVVVILLQKQLTIDRILLLTLGIDLAKTLLVILFTPFDKTRYKFSFKADYLKKSFPFFLLMFTSLLASRIDQVSAALFLGNSELGKYQILVSFLLIIQASSNFILQPFIKNLYRLKFITIQKIAVKLFLCGILIAAIGILFTYNILVLFYRIEFDFTTLLFGYFFTLPIFFYSPYIFYLYKTEKTNFVILANMVGSLISVISSFVLMTVYGKGILVMLLPACAVQYLTVVGYILFATFNQSTVANR